MTSGVGMANWQGFGSAIGQKLWTLSSERICVQARRRTGLQDFGNPNLEPALSILVTSLEAEAQLHPLGRLLMRVHLRELLETRLRLTAAWRQNPDVLNGSMLQRPVFIVGMPRSGSTFLHELLAEDPANRAPRVWEVMFPIRAKETGGEDPRRRVRKASTRLWWFRKLAPDADSVYPMRA
jgi:hypothetical protein